MKIQEKLRTQLPNPPETKMTLQKTSSGTVLIRGWRREKADLGAARWGVSSWSNCFGF